MADCCGLALRWRGMTLFCPVSIIPASPSRQNWQVKRSVCLAAKPRDDKVNASPQLSKN
jgi:hypothetical protein